MKRCFSLLNKEYDFEGLPVFKLHEFAAEPCEADWAGLPAITSFRSRASDDRAPAADFAVKIAVGGDKLYFRAFCETYSDIEIPMKEQYLGWNFDNSFELFAGTCGRFHQFLVNARGAAVYYFNRSKAALPDGVEVRGSKAPGKWDLTLSMPADLLLVNGEAAFKIVCTDMESILGAQYYDSLNNQCRGFGVMSTACIESDPQFDVKSLNDVDWGFCRKMAQSAFKHSNLPVPELASPTEIQGALHTVRNKLIPAGKEIAEIDFSVPSGEIRPIYGINFGPQIVNQGNHDMNEAYRKLGSISMRTHDAGLIEYGSRIVDTIFVFPLEHADPSDPGNYYFDQTDYYLKNTMDQGSQIYYRLGVSIDHAKVRFTAHKPKDFNHYAEVCAGIVRHYNKGWANGHHWNIQYWEVWNEPESVLMWDGTFDEYLDLFVTVYKRLKSEFPELKVGGFGATSLSVPHFKQMAAKCAEHNIKPDFISWHHYSSNMDGMIFQPYAARFLADAIGFENAELHLTEWHYVNIGPGTPEGYEDMGGVDSAVFTAGVLSGWQDSPIDLSHYYAAGAGWAWCIWDSYYKPKKVYYALTQCGLLQNQYKHRVRAVQGKNGTYIIGGLDEQQNGFAMFGSFKNSEKEEVFCVKGIPADREVKISVLDEENILQEIEYQRDGAMFRVKKNSPSSLYILTF